MKSLLRLSFLLPLLFFGYAAGYLALQLNVGPFFGHVIMALLALSGLALTIFGFYCRYEVLYRDASMHRDIVKLSLGLGVGFAALALIHGYAVVTRVEDNALLWLGEPCGVALLSLAIVIWVLEGRREDRRRSR